MADSAVSRMARLVAGGAARMIGWSAGLPLGNTAGQIVDPSMAPLQGAIPLRGEAPSDYQRNGTSVRVRGFERHPVASACIRAIVDIAAAVPIQVYRKIPIAGTPDQYDVMLLPGSAGQTLLDAPSPFLSAQRLRAYLFAHVVTYGNAFWFLERPLPTSPTPNNTQAPTALRVIQPEDITTVFVNNIGYPLYYLWRDYLGYTHTSPATDLMHYRDLNVRGLVFGFPRAASALNDIIGDDEASQYVREVVTNHGQPGAWVLTNDETTVKEAKVIDAQLQEELVTRGGRGRTKVLGGIKDIKSVAFDLRDLEFPDLRRVAREDICAAFGVDPRMVGITSASRDAGLSGTQYLEARRRLIQQTIEPLMRAVESELNLWLAPEFGDVYMRFDPESLQALVEDDEATSTRVREEYKAGIRSLPESRRAINLPSEMDASDLVQIPVGVQIVTAKAMQVLGTAAEAPLTNPDGSPIDPNAPGGGAPGALPPGDEQSDPADAGTLGGNPAPDNAEKDLQESAGANPNNPSAPVKVQDGAVDEPLAKKRATATAVIISPAEVMRAVAPHGNVLVRGVKLSADQRVMLWQDFDARARNEEPAFKRQALLLFGEERASINALCTQEAAAHEGHADGDAMALASIRRAVVRMYKPGGTVRARWQDKFTPLIRDVYQQGGESIAKRAAAVRATRPPKKKPHAPAPSVPLATFHVDNPQVQAAITARAERLAMHVGDTTGSTITDTIALGQREGLGVREIAKLIDTLAFGTSSATRSEMIARTETVGALNQSEFETAKSGDIITYKEWLTQGDDRVRDSHYECEDEGQILMDDAFDNGLSFPGDPDGDAEEVINCRCTLLYYDEGTDGQSTIDGAGAPRDA